MTTRSGDPQSDPDGIYNPGYLGWKLAYHYGVSRSPGHATFRDAYMADRPAPDPTAGIPAEALRKRAESERINARWAQLRAYMALGVTERCYPNGKTYLVDKDGNKIDTPAG